MNIHQDYTLPSLLTYHTYRVLCVGAILICSSLNENFSQSDNLSSLSKTIQCNNQKLYFYYNHLVASMHSSLLMIQRQIEKYSLSIQESTILALDTSQLLVEIGKSNKRRNYVNSLTIMLHSVIHIEYTSCTKTLMTFFKKSC